MGIQLISKGAVILRRRSCAANWIRTDTVPPGSPNGSCNSQIQRIFAAQDFIQKLQESKELLEHCLVLTGDHQLEHRLKADDGSWSIEESYIKQTRGSEFAGEVDSLTGSLLAGCNGHRRLRDILVELASRSGMELEQIAPAGLAVARKMMQLGFLNPITSPSSRTEAKFKPR